MKKLLLFAAVVFCLFLALPLFQMLTGFPPDYKLAGVETPVARPPLGLSAWWQGTLQSGFDTWLSQNIGGRGVLVRTANQLRYSLFRELPVRGGTQVRIYQAASGSRDVSIDGQVIKGDGRRGKGIHANAVMRADPLVKNTGLQDVIGGSIVFYDTQVKLVRA